MREVRPRLCVVDGVLKLWMDGIDRENKIYETLDPDGTWRRVGLYEANENGAFVIPESQTRDIIDKLTGEPPA